MWYVYIIRSLSSPAQEYTGLSEDLKQRIKDHNAGKSTHTSKYVPWELAWYCAFPDKRSALDFEKYLKSHSGRAFASKRLTPKLVARDVTVQQEAIRRLFGLGGSDPDAVAAPRRRFGRA